MEGVNHFVRIVHNVDFDNQRLNRIMHCDHDREVEVRELLTGHSPRPHGHRHVGYGDRNQNQGNQGVGSQGPQGNQGIAGPQGPAGVDGVSGPQGYQGVAGAQGPAGLLGPQGYPGSTGSNGPQGNQGHVGNQGNQGNQGNIGPQGHQGVQGPQGLQGAKGITDQARILSISTPSIGDNLSIIYTTKNSNLKKIIGVITGGSAESVSISVKHGVNRSGGVGETLLLTETVDSYLTGNEFTLNVQIPAGHFVYAVINSMTGFPVMLELIAVYEEVG